MSSNDDVVLSRRSAMFQTPNHIQKKPLGGLKSSNLTSAKRRPLSVLNPNNNVSDCRTCERPKLLPSLTKPVLRMSEAKNAFKKPVKPSILEDEYEEIEKMFIEEKPAVDLYEDVIPLKEQPTTYLSQFVLMFPSISSSLYYSSGTDRCYNVDHHDETATADGFSAEDDFDYLKSDKELLKVNMDELMMLDEEIAAATSAAETADDDDNDHSDDDDDDSNDHVGNKNDDVRNVLEFPPMHFFDDLFLSI
ncbi:hypothetical protein HELRODRAFT_191619 [Helobdella robusta]|uniref:Uncharacterized protein n=1 Tax=Helobdella robusta TaxID=6412 RepID=T1FT48_HELRO|nr:hypothetical protein HELRODRAFT_191619 [Helobdella robusta]ESO04557.1 hypothetical protein HELRODRAFT_191619 [Helobdella robusta]